MTQLPLRGLWRDSGPLAASRVRALSPSDARELLRAGEVQFVIADVGRKPRWIELQDCYRFWMEEVQHHLVEPEAKIIPGEMPNVYCYRAAEWHSAQVAVPIVVLEVCH